VRVGELAGLVWRDDCLACGRVDAPPAVEGLSLCRGCAADLRRVPSRVPGPGKLPVFTAGMYGGAHRGVVLAAKEQRRADAVRVAGAVMAGVLRHVVAEGLLPDPRLAPLVLLPAPTTRRAAKDRGGCVVRRAADVACAELGEGGHVVSAATMAPSSRDSVGLGRGERAANIAANLRIDPGSVRRAARILRATGAAACIVDDVSTTGATLSGFAGALAAHGLTVDAAVVVAQA
jgi:predicted amidophosphoribosyltransferase